MSLAFVELCLHRGERVALIMKDCDLRALGTSPDRLALPARLARWPPRHRNRRHRYPGHLRQHRAGQRHGAVAPDMVTGAKNAADAGRWQSDRTPQGLTT